MGALLTLADSVIDHRMLAAFEMQCSLLPYPWRKE